MIYNFNTKPLVRGPVVENADPRLIEATPQLRRAALSDAVLFGGPLVRQALQSAPLVGDRKHVIVDTKVSMLMPGWCPAIPGWHTDGVPRGDSGNPASSGMPSLERQQFRSDNGYFPRFHTVVFGVPCMTQYVTDRMAMEVNGETPELYSDMTAQVQELLPRLNIATPDIGEWVSWDWWQVHQAAKSADRGWRLLIRVTESSDVAPEPNFIRTQSQVYVEHNYGW